MTAMIYLLFASVWKHLMQLYQDSQKLCPLQNKKSVLQAVNLFSNTVQTKLAITDIKLCPSNLYKNNVLLCLKRF